MPEMKAGARVSRTPFIILGLWWKLEDTGDCQSLAQKAVHILTVQLERAGSNPARPTQFHQPQSGGRRNINWLGQV